MEIEFKFKTKPFQHQLDEFNKRNETEAYALYWEQGTGKTKAILDQVSACYLNKYINALLIVAPNMVHRNWIKEEIPTHLSVDENRVLAHFYETKSAGTNWHKDVLKRLLKFDGLSILAITYDAFVTKAGKEFCKKFLSSRKVFYVLDEATKVKSPGAIRTKTIVASGKYAKFKRILTGTPVTQGPFDIYASIKFLDEDFWKRHGLGNYQAFKNYFGVFEENYNAKYQRKYQELLGYQRLDELQQIIKPISSRVLKRDVLDLPEKMYSKRFFELSSEQKRVYDEIKEQYITELMTGEIIEAPLALSRILKLHQITCNYLNIDDKTQTISDRNPRLESLLELCDEISTQTIIWCRFRSDIDQICNALGRNAVRFDGILDNDTRQKNLDKFREGEAQYFISTTEVGGTGLTLNEADTVIYYSNNYRLENRLQSEDRCHRAGQTKSVQYIDIIAPGTVDEHIVNALRKKMDISNMITGDKWREWL